MNFPGPNQFCNIDFNQVQQAIINVDLTGEVCILTLEPFIPGQDYYQVSVSLSPHANPTVNYFSINEFHEWFEYHRVLPCKHPMFNVSITLNNIRRFTYNGPPPFVGGRKRRSKKQKTNRRISLQK